MPAKLSAGAPAIAQRGDMAQLQLLNSLSRGVNRRRDRDASAAIVFRFVLGDFVHATGVSASLEFRLQPAIDDDAD